ncbi:hypothetical protein RAD15_19240 [Bradyrhizobium sp. 14AA]
MAGISAIIFLLWHPGFQRFIGTVEKFHGRKPEIGIADILEIVDLVFALTNSR